MKLSCLPVSFFTEIIGGSMTIAEWPGWGEISGWMPSISASCSSLTGPARSAGAAKAGRGGGNAGAMVTSYPDFTHPDAAQRGRELALAQEVVDVAAGMGAEMVRVTAGQAHPRDGRPDGIALGDGGPDETGGQPADIGSCVWSMRITRNLGVAVHRLLSIPDIFLAIARATAGSVLGSTSTRECHGLQRESGRSPGECLDRLVSVHAADTSELGALKPVLLDGSDPLRGDLSPVSPGRLE